jgi:hypothetical protein
MEKFKHYFNTNKKTSVKEEAGYAEGVYGYGSTFVLTKKWENYNAGSEFILTEETSTNVLLRAGLGIFKGSFKDPNGIDIKITGSKTTLQELFKFKPKPVQPEPQQPQAPVYIVEKQIIRTDPEVTKEFIEKIVEQMVLAGPQGQMGLRGPAGPPGPPGPPGPVVIAENTSASGIAGAQVSAFDFGGLQTEAKHNVSIDLGTI